MKNDRRSQSRIKRLLTRAAIAALALDGAATAHAVSTSEAEDVVVSAIDDDEVGEWSSPDQERILAAFARDPRVRVRRAAANRAADLPTPLSREGKRLLRNLTGDRDDSVRAVAAQSLATILQRMDGLDRTNLACKWSTSRQPDQRLAVARALAVEVDRTRDVLGAELCIEHLIADPAPDIRRAAAHAAWTRLRHEPTVYAPLLTALLDDPDPTIAEIANLARLHT